MADLSPIEITPPPAITKSESERKHSIVESRINALKNGINKLGISVPEHFKDNHQFWLNVYLDYSTNEGTTRAAFKDISRQGEDPEVLNNKKRLYLGNSAVKHAEILTTEQEMNGIDGLTGIWNRRALDKRVIQLKEWKKDPHNNDALVVVGLLDIDDYKKFNTDYGLTGGDEVLRGLAGSAQESIKAKTDFAGRYGGDEFVLLVIVDRLSLKGSGLFGKTEEEKVGRIFERTREEIMDHMRIQIGGQEVHPTISMGVSVMNPNDSLEEIYKKASDQLKRAKTEGKDATYTIAGKVPSLKPS